jgi:enoyl-CoA hydratase/carnithine racemase
MDQIIVEKNNACLHLRLNRPEKKNALNGQMYTHLASQIELAKADDSVLTIVITAEGDDFSAGNDVADFAQGVASGKIFSDPIDEIPVFQFLKAITFLDKPLLAAVQGQAVGIGTTMLLHCDAVVASDCLRLKLPFIPLGLVPEAASSYLLVQKLGYVRAFEWLTQKPHLSADEALHHGLLNRIVPKSELISSITEISNQLTRLPKTALRQSKTLMRKPDELWEIIIKEGHLFRQRLQSQEARDAFMNFLSR